MAFYYYLLLDEYSIFLSECIIPNFFLPDTRFSFSALKVLKQVLPKQKDFENSQNGKEITE